MRVRVYVTELMRGFVDLDVESGDEVLEKAEEAYFDGRVEWTGGDWNMKRWEEIPADAPSTPGNQELPF